MEKYELTIVLPGKATLAKKKSVTEAIEKIVKVFGGKVSKKDDWGKIDLAYEIQKNESGNFLFFQLELDADKVKELNNKLRLEEGIIRFLLVKIND